jgi:hypothetical protein
MCALIIFHETIYSLRVVFPTLERVLEARTTHVHIKQNKVAEILWLLQQMAVGQPTRLASIDLVCANLCALSICAVHFCRTQPQNISRPTQIRKVTVWYIWYIYLKRGCVRTYEHTVLKYDSLQRQGINYTLMLT